MGIAPSRQGAEGQPLTSLGGPSTGAKLAALAGLGELQYLNRFDRVNLCPTVQPSTIPVSLGRPMAEMLAGSILRLRRVVFLGANVAECFGLKREMWEPCVWRNLKDGTSPNKGCAGYSAGRMMPPFHWAVLPHPSGRNLWYNEPSNREMARAFMTELAEGWEGAD